MKKELLSPAGSVDAALAAIHAGADAIYLSGQSFGARSLPSNFTNEDIEKIIAIAHNLNVKVYVTINTLILDSEIDSLMDFVAFLCNLSVDALIIQDVGIAKLIHDTYPDLELHASTQMHNLDKYSSLFLENLGFKRIVLARELSLCEINNFDTSLEKEAFVHGALCISYSGACLFGSMAMDRSGNRGKCSQMCRMPFNLEVGGNTCSKSGKYLLSSKDIKTASIFNELMESDIHSYKIEGRSKSPQYVYTVTKMYRKLIDAYYNNEEVDVSNDEKILDSLFNRGYSTGHYYENNELMNTKRPGNKGVLIGDVIEVDDKIITIKLTDSLRIKDGIKFENADKGLTVYNLYKDNNQIKEGLPSEIVTIPNNVGLTDNDTVVKTLDDHLNDEILKYEEKKLLLDIEVEALIGKELSVTFTYADYKVNFKSEVLEAAQNKATTKDEIIEKVSKLGATVFTVNNIVVNMSDNVFVRLSSINDLRRKCVDELLKLNDKINIYEKKDINYSYERKSVRPGLSVFIRNKKQLDIVSHYPIERFYTDNYDLYMDNKDLNMYYSVHINEDCDLENILVSSTSDLMKYKDRNIVLDYGLNTYNSLTLNYLKDFGEVVYSPELKIDELKKINRKINNRGELLIYGKPVVMKMNHCLLFNERNCDTCKYDGKYKDLVDYFDRTYKVKCNNRINYIYNHKPILKIRDLDIYKSIGMEKFRIDFLDESEYEINKILTEYFENIV